LLAGQGSSGDRIALVSAAAVLGVVGLVDDVRGIGPIPRLGLQVMAAALCLPWLLEGLTGSGAWRAALALGVLLWLVAYVNAFNFMDGINGMAVAQVVVAGGAWYLVGRHTHASFFALGAIVMAGAALGFAPFNFPGARMFLGDVGSYFLGAWVGVLAIVGVRSGVAAEAVLGPLAIYLADTGSTLVSRVVQGQPWYAAHRDHVYQRLVRGGQPHSRITALIALAMTGCAALGAVSVGRSTVLRVGADVALAGVLAGYLTAPYWAGRLRPSSSPARV
jgi:UDP-N-acetylmuramyl pentapeptide phosphotransferase/UDP-N-acetylglucosamine-1-phosphate transferase